MKSMNKTQLIGYLGKDPEIKEFSTGTVKANLSLSTKTKSHNTDPFGEPIYHTTWHKVVIWGKERVEKIIHQYIKGSHVLVEGKIVYRSYIDKTGRKCHFTEINAYSLMNLDR